MGNRPHPHGRRDSSLVRMTDIQFEAECDRAYLEGTALDEAEKAERIRWAENSPEQREFEGHDDGCESEFITEAGMWSPCQCGDRDAE